MVRRLERKTRRTNGGRSPTCSRTIGRRTTKHRNRLDCRAKEGSVKRRGQLGQEAAEALQESLEVRNGGSGCGHRGLEDHSTVPHDKPNENKLSGRFTATRSDAVPVRWSAWLGDMIGEAVFKPSLRYKPSREPTRKKTPNRCWSIRGSILPSEHSSPGNADQEPNQWPPLWRRSLSFHVLFIIPIHAA